jgi:hypothetical protein
MSFVKFSDLVFLWYKNLPDNNDLIYPIMIICIREYGLSRC